MEDDWMIGRIICSLCGRYEICMECTAFDGRRIFVCEECMKKQSKNYEELKGTPWKGYT